MSPREARDVELTEEMRVLLAAGAKDVVEYDYERGFAAHLAAIGLPVAPGGPPAAGPSAAAGAGGAGAAAGASGVLATAAGAPPAWLGFVAVPLATAAVAVALWFGGAFAHEPGAPPEARTAAPSVPAAAPGSLNPSTPVVELEEAPSAEESAPEKPGARAARAAAPRRALAKPNGARAKTEAPPEPPAAERSVANFPEPPPTAPSPSTDETRAVASSAEPTQPTPEQRFEEEIQRRKRAVAVQEKQADRLRLEMDALAEAKRALASDPLRAFTIARDGERQFGRSVLSEERQHVLILALLKLGRFADARRVAAPYLQRHPDSPFARRVQKALDAAGAQSR